MRRRIAWTIGFVVLLGAGVTAADGEPAALRSADFKTVLIPFQNQTNEAQLDYLSLGIARLLSSKLETTGFVRETRSKKTFVIQPGAARSEPTVDEPLRVLPVNIVLREEGDWAKLAAVKDSRYMCAKLKADAWIGGSITRSPEPARDLIITVRLFRCDTGQETVKTYTRPLNTIYKNLDEPVEHLQTSLIAEKRFSVSFESAEPGSMIFLDGVYVGRSPVVKPVIAGRYVVRAEAPLRRPFESRIDVKSDMSVSVDSPAVTERGALKVSSDPEGASVYLDMTYLGKTPIDRKDLPPGTHRLRISMEGRIDRFVGVVIKEDGVAEVAVKLVEGDTVKTYKDPGYVILDWTRHDFSLYCALSSAVFYAGWAHYRIRADRIEDSLSTYIPSLLVTKLPERNLYELYLYRENQHAANRERRKADVSGGIGIGLLFLSGYFLYSGISHDDKEGGEISTRLRFQFAVIPAARRDYAWSAAMQIRF